MKLLIGADLVAKNNFTQDFVSTNVVENYISLIQDKQANAKVDEVLNDMRNLIGVKKKEINWAQVATAAIGIAALNQGKFFMGGVNTGNRGKITTEGTPSEGNASNSGEVTMAAMNANNERGINIYSPVLY